MKKLLVSYTCSKCGAALSTEITQQFLDCPFCGNAYDIGEIHHDELVNEAKHSLNRREFLPANEKYRMILTSDPQDFDALLGLVLSAGRFVSVDSLRDSDSLVRCPADDMRAAVSYAQANADENDVPYFDKLAELLDKADSIRNMDSDILNISGKADAEYKTNKRVRKTGTTTARYPSEKSIIYIMTGIVFALVVLFCIFDGLRYARLVIVGVIAAILLMIFVPKIVRSARRDSGTAKHRAKMAGMTSEIGSITEEKNKVKESYGIAFGELKTMSASGKTSASKKLRRVSEEENDYTELNGKTITCTKCAGALTLDKDRQIYRCDHCGVAFGSSLFIGNPLEKARFSLRTRNFIDAQQQYTFALMLDPSNFEANRGLVLCDLRLTSFLDLQYRFKFARYRSENFADHVSEAYDRVSQEDREYFLTVKDFVRFNDEKNTSSSSSYAVLMQKKAACEKELATCNKQNTGAVKELEKELEKINTAIENDPVCIYLMTCRQKIANAENSHGIE